MEESSAACVYARSGKLYTMKILVCVKQVPDAEELLPIDPEGSWITGQDGMVFRMNRFDEFALEEAMRIKERFSGSIDVTIDSVSVGPERVRSTLKKSLALGAENGFHILVEEEGYLSPFDTAALIASFAGGGDYGLILAGVMAEDDMQSLVGSFVAEILGYPCATAVMYQEVRDDRKRITVEREIEAGRRERLRLNLPAVLTVQSGINSPRYPTLTNVLRAKDQEIVTISAGRLAVLQKRERVVSLAYPEISSQGTFLEGTAQEKAQALLQALHGKAFI